MHNLKLKDGIKVTTKHVELHPKFHNYSSYDDYDIALLSTNEIMEFSSRIKPICLPNVNEDVTGLVGIVAGWLAHLNS